MTQTPAMERMAVATNATGSWRHPPAFAAGGGAQGRVDRRSKSATAWR